MIMPRERTTSVNDQQVVPGPERFTAAAKEEEVRHPSMRDVCVVRPVTTVTMSAKTFPAFLKQTAYEFQ